MAKNEIRNIEFIIYDEKELKEVIAKTKELKIDYAYIYHDEDMKEDLSGKKKKHYHVQIYSENQKSLKRWQEIYNMPTQRTQKITNKIQAIRYLIHADNNTKYQYEIERIVTNFDISKYFENMVSDTSLELETIIKYINQEKETISKNKLLWFCLDNNLFKSYRSYYMIIRDIIEEHNLLLNKIQK